MDPDTASPFDPPPDDELPCLPWCGGEDGDTVTVAQFWSSWDVAWVFAVGVVVGGVLALATRRMVKGE